MHMQARKIQNRRSDLDIMGPPKLLTLPPSS
jgi:hypothetical protein